MPNITLSIMQSPALAPVRPQGVISDVPDLTVHVLVWPQRVVAGTLSQPYQCYRPMAIFTSPVYFDPSGVEVGLISSALRSTYVGLV